MSRRFVVGISNASEAQITALREHFQNQGSWWNWIPNFWLVITTNHTTPIQIREQIKRIAPGAQHMVIDAKDDGASDTWTGWGPNVAPRDMFEWMRSSWKNYSG